MNESHVSGAFDETKGKIKQAFGEATGDQATADEGAMDQVKGNVKQGWGDVKDAAHNLTHSNAATETRVDAEQNAHQARNSFVQGVENVKDSISRGLHDLTHKANE